ncbi:MAG: HAD family phosphatase [Oscillospiraceae bacterium]|nr:HAD family phosphatase [Oscillospiraceae bacterium]
MKVQAERAAPIVAKAVIFDMDGTIIDTLQIWGDVDRKFLSKRGLPVPPDYLKSISLMSFDCAAQYTRERFSLNESVEDILNEWIEFAEHEYVNSAKLFPHVLEYLDELKKSGVKIALATAAIKRFYEKALSANGILSYFDVLCSVEEVGVGKTEPAVYLLTMKKLGVEPHECVIFEDVEQAAITAVKTGAKVYLVHSKNPLEQEHENINVIEDFRQAPLVQLTIDS